MKKERVIYAIILSSILLTVGLWSVFGGVVITPDSFDVYTKIRCSNGNIYNATYENLQIALNQKGFIRLPECNITITTPLQVYGGTVLYGCGNKTILYGGTSSNTYMNLINITIGSKSVRIEGIRFDCNNASRNGAYSSAIWIKPSTSNITIRDCSFDRIRYYGIHQESTASYGHGNTTVENCVFSRHAHLGYGGAICFRASGNRATGNKIYDMWATGIVVEGGDVTRNNIIDGNVIIGPCSVGLYSEGSHSSCQTIFSNNIVMHCNNTAYGGSPDGVGILVTENSTATGNIVSFCARGGIRGDGDNIVISSNQIIDCGFGYNGGYGILTAGDNCSITGNYIYNELTGDAGINLDYGIRIYSRTIVDSNIITVDSATNYWQFGIQTAGSGESYNVISNNQIYNGLYGIELRGGYENIHDNTLINCGKANYPAIRIYGGNFCRISNNNLYTADRGIQLTDVTNTSITGNILDVNDATYSTYEDGTCSNNQFRENNYEQSTTKLATIIGTGSLELFYNATTAKIGFHTASGTIWK